MWLEGIPTCPAVYLYKNSNASTMNSRPYGINWATRESTLFQELMYWQYVKEQMPNCLSHYSLIIISVRNSLAVQWLELRAFVTGAQSSIPVWGTKILQATWHGKRKKILCVHHSNPDFSFFPTSESLVWYQLGPLQDLRACWYQEHLNQFAQISNIHLNHELLCLF